MHLYIRVHDLAVRTCVYHCVVLLPLGADTETHFSKPYPYLFYLIWNMCSLVLPIWRTEMFIF